MLPPQSLLRLGAREKSWVVMGSVAGKTVSLYLPLGEREKKDILEWDKRNERHAVSQTWDGWATIFRTGNTQIFEGRKLIGEKEETKEHLCFNQACY